MKSVNEIESHIAGLRIQLKNHPLYISLQDLNDVQVFMELHAFAVWDFMSLLKSLQQNLTHIALPWMPSNNPKLTRFINEIVVAEESDLNEEGNPMSHFQMYRDAMVQTGANTSPLDVFIQCIHDNFSVQDALIHTQVDKGVAAFVNYTFSVIDSNKPHQVAAAFTFGREDVIPDMFIKILDQSDKSNTKYKKLRYYLERHIELDGDEHGPLALLMIEELCGNDTQKWDEVARISYESLEHRIALWNAILARIQVK